MNDRAALGLLVIAAVIAVLYASGCASGPMGAATATPQVVQVTIDASDGGTITISGQVWLDARGSTESDQTGLDVDSTVDADVDSAVTTGSP